MTLELNLGFSTTTVALVAIRSHVGTVLGRITGELEAAAEHLTHLGGDPDEARTDLDDTDSILRAIVTDYGPTLGELVNLETDVARPLIDYAGLWASNHKAPASELGVYEAELEGIRLAQASALDVHARAKALREELELVVAR